MINSQDIKKGTCIRLDGKLYFCVDFLHVKPGKGNTIMRTTLKDVVKGGQIERRFNIGEKLEDVRVERRPYQYTYQEGEHYHFMNQETFDDIIIMQKPDQRCGLHDRRPDCGSRFRRFNRNCSVRRYACKSTVESNLYGTGYQR